MACRVTGRDRIAVHSKRRTRPALDALSAPTPTARTSPSTCVARRPALTDSARLPRRPAAGLLRRPDRRLAPRRSRARTRRRAATSRPSTRSRSACSRRPASYGADIVVGEGQSARLAGELRRAVLGLFACREQYIRQMPGRIVGQTSGPRRPHRLRAHAPDARAAHPPRARHLQHLHQPAARRPRGDGLPRDPRQARPAPGRRAVLPQGPLRRAQLAQRPRAATPSTSTSRSSRSSSSAARARRRDQPPPARTRHHRRPRRLDQVENGMLALRDRS